MKAALYGRYSSEGQREASIEDQFRNCERRAEHEGWTITARYHDKGISGSRDEKGRPGYCAMLSAAKGRQFDVLLVDDLSRLTRDEGELIKRRLDTSGSGVFSHSHDPFGRPRGRSVDSIPNRLAIRRTQPSSPKGRPRCTLTRRASNSEAAWGRFTRANQSRGCSTGHGLSHVVSLAFPCSRRHKLDHCHVSARWTSLARSALRST